LTTKLLAKKIALLALTKKASDVTVLDLRKITDMADFFIICSGDSDIQVKAIADAIADGTDELGMGPWHREGLTQSQWILLDYVDIVVHIFHSEARKFYSLEKIWGDAKIERIEDKPPAKSTAKPKPAKRAAKPAAKRPAKPKKAAASAK